MHPLRSASSGEAAAWLVFMSPLAIAGQPCGFLYCGQCILVMALRVCAYDPRYSCVTHTTKNVIIFGVWFTGCAVSYLATSCLPSESVPAWPLRSCQALVRFAVALVERLGYHLPHEARCAVMQLACGQSGTPWVTCSSAFLPTVAYRRGATA